MKREGRGPCEIEFDEYVFITRKKNRLVRHSLTITSFTKKYHDDQDLGRFVLVLHSIYLKFQGNVGNNVLTKKVKHSQKLRKVIGTCMDPEIMYP